jgi:hypothetical protein
MYQQQRIALSLGCLTETTIAAVAELTITLFTHVLAAAG